VRVFKPEMAATPTTLKEQEKEHILNALKMADGNRTQAAKILGIDRVSLWRKLKKLGIDSN
jgi:transcriptional regulator of acetoin/glycerol metabolism